jgi:hypothetical protein
MYRINRSTHTTKEEKVAQKISVLLSDFTLDLEKVGYYLAKAIPLLLFKRSLEVLESAQFQDDIMEQQRIGYDNDRLLY